MLQNGARVLEEREHKATSIIKELSQLITEQQQKLDQSQSELHKKQQTITTLTEKCQQLETVSKNGDEKLSVLTKELDRLNAKMVAQESLLRGLKEERSLWSKELAAQGATLSADRGKMESTIATLSTSLETIKSDNTELKDGLRIKTAMLTDNNDTIRTLKQTLADREKELKNVREEQGRSQSVLQERLDAEKISNHDLAADLETTLARKQELKEALAQATRDLEATRMQHEKKERVWREKADLIGQLEAQVEDIRKMFTAKEEKLVMYVICNGYNTNIIRSQVN